MKIKTRVRISIFLVSVLEWWGRIKGSRVVVWVTGPWKSLRMWWRKRQINKSLRILDALDWHMRKAGWSRKQRRQFWHDFIKKQEFRTGTLNRLTRQ